jgi:tetratricopeptide (TPR) repeat protein
LKKIQIEIMQSLKNITRLTFFIFLLFSVHERIYGRQQDVSAVKAMQLFDAGNYAEAEKFFRILLEDDPGNPMLNYYYGASRTENGNFDESDLNHLLQAGKNVTPDRLNYYLGMQYHARNNWERALKYYNQFRLSVPEDEQRELKLAEKIQQCFDHKNPFAKSQTQHPESERKIVNQTEPTLPETAGQPETDTLQQNILTDEKAGAVITETGVIPENYSQEEEQQPETKKTTDKFDIGRKALPDLPGVKPTYDLPDGEQIEFQVSNQVTYLFTSQFKTDEGKQLFEQGQALKRSLDEKINELNRLREAYKNERNPETKAELGKKILTLETDSYSLKDEISRKFAAARKVENQYWSSAGSIAIYNFQIENEKIKSVLKGKKSNQQPTALEKDSIVILPLAVSEIYESQSTGVNQTSGKLVYKIQIGAYSRGIPAYRQRLFDKLSLIRKIDNYTDENGVVVYTTGNLTSLEDAEKMLNQVRQEGIEDAIIAPYFNEKRITLEQAKKIEAGDDI